MRLAECEGHTLIVLFAPTITEPVSFDEKIYQRVGSSTLEVKADQQFYFNTEFAAKVRQRGAVSSS